MQSVSSVNQLSARGALHFLTFEICIYFHPRVQILKHNLIYVIPFSKMGSLIYCYVLVIYKNFLLSEALEDPFNSQYIELCNRSSGRETSKRPPHSLSTISSPISHQTAVQLVWLSLSSSWERLHPSQRQEERGKCCCTETTERTALSV